MLHTLKTHGWWWARNGLFLALIAASYSARIPVPDNDTLRAIYSIARILQFLALCLCFLCASLSLVAFRQSDPALPTRLRYTDVFLTLTMLLGITGAALGTFGDSVIHWAYQQPVEAAVTAFFILAMIQLGKLARTLALPPQSLRAFSPVSPHDQQASAYHEVGHALTFAALPEIPATLTLSINSFVDTEEQLLGQLKHTPYRLELLDQQKMEWHLLSLLGGQQAEGFALGRFYSGAASDYARWMSDAHGFLANQFRGLYYRFPKNTHEQAHNLAQLTSLHQEQVALLQALFTENETILHGMAKELLERKKLNRRALAPWLGKVTLPEGFPRPDSPWNPAQHD